MNGTMPPNTGADLILGLIVIASELGLYLVSLALRYRNLQKERTRLEQLLQTAPPDNLQPKSAAIH